LQAIRKHTGAGGELWLFLDYDGTLVPIAPAPELAVPDPGLLHLLVRLASIPRFRVAILSGRSLSSLQALLPIRGLILAGLYGIEIQMPDGTILRRTEATDLRHTVERVKEAWIRLIDHRAGFLVEDKGLAVALHARHASPSDAHFVLPRAETVVAQLPTAQYRVLGGDRFLEIAPSAAHKGRSVEWLLEHAGMPNALPVYFGDDDKDEEAFGVVREHGGIPIIVGTREPVTRALVRLPSPVEVRRFLEQLATDN
jgi:trehalose 6-phosphate phosphatase